jgi:hypothetical protein
MGGDHVELGGNNDGSERNVRVGAARSLFSKGDDLGP